MAIDTQAMYDAAAGDWRRDGPLLLSDFTARERALELLGDLQGARLWDLGCGEGYVARLVAEAGAASVFGVDVSSAMVQRARSEIGRAHV